MTIFKFDVVKKSYRILNNKKGAIYNDHMDPYYAPLNVIISHLIDGSLNHFLFIALSRN